LESDSTFAVSGRESAEVLDSIEAAFDAVAEFVEGPVVWPLHFTADLGWDDGDGTHGLDGGDDGVGVIASVRHVDLGLTTGQQGRRFGELSGLASGKPEGDGLARAVGQQMDLGAQSTSGTPQSLVFAPFLRPVAACW
jgi:hypothetical protein